MEEVVGQYLQSKR